MSSADLLQTNGMEFSSFEDHSPKPRDTTARARFATLYHDTLRAYLAARWRGGSLAQELDDAVQDVYLECFKDNGALARSDERQAGGFRAYLYGVARNVARR